MTEIFLRLLDCGGAEAIFDGGKWSALDFSTGVFVINSDGFDKHSHLLPRFNNEIVNFRMAGILNRLQYSQFFK